MGVIITVRGGGGENNSTVGANISTVEGDHQFSGGCSVKLRENISTVVVVQNSGGITSVK